MTALEMATQLVNRWTSECLWLEDPKKQGALLIQMIAGVIDQIEQKAYERGRRDEVTDGN